jgi:uncharacterized protein YciI
MEGQDLWPEHARFMDDMVESGFLVLGGPLVDGRAVLVFDTEDEAEVEGRLETDPWTESGHLNTVSSELWTIRLDGRRW